MNIIPLTSTNPSPKGDIIRVKVGDEEAKGRLGLLSCYLVGDGD